MKKIIKKGKGKKKAKFFCSFCGTKWESNKWMYRCNFPLESGVDSCPVCGEGATVPYPIK